MKSDSLAMRITKQRTQLVEGLVVLCVRLQTDQVKQKWLLRLFRKHHQTHTKYRMKL
ncbi:unnamed protein product [Paramecium primaurelia]|uniref:Uncharacterized protein n=1 Tax=Paramecium primaurelia TaxID=5886 RepID=A0A8S1NJH3_PARPR|nr:unnamed protein product [Paramecium primaurelia]